MDVKELIENIQILADYGNSDGQSEYERGFAAACEIIIDIIMTMNE